MQVPARHLPLFPICTGDTPRGLFRRATRALAERCGREAESGARLPRGGPPFTYAADLRPATAPGSPLLVCVPGLRFHPPVVALGESFEMGTALFDVLPWILFKQ